jgi:hypothetical protein
MYLPVDLIEVDVLVVGVLELDVLGARRNSYLLTCYSSLLRFLAPSQGIIIIFVFQLECA